MATPDEPAEEDYHLELLFYTTIDPEDRVMNMKIPATTTLLYRVCDNNHERFDEAIRLIKLFMDAAYEEGKKTHDQHD